MKQQYVMLAEKFEPAKHNPVGWFLSEKLDGLRCIWDGGVSRGQLSSTVPYANTTKDARFVTPPRASGLWTRYGKVIHAPDSFLDQLPQHVVLDGELTMGRGTFQDMTAARSLSPDLDEWSKVHFMVFDAPSPRAWLGNRAINVKPHLNLTLKDCMYWFLERGGKDSPPRTFDMSIKRLESLKEQYPGEVWEPVEQMQIEDANDVDLTLHSILELGGEGVMLRSPYSVWRPVRTSDLRKYKPYNDAEGRVVGYTWGEETDLGSKLLGMMGAMIVSWNGKRFKLSGFTDAERTMVTCKSGGERSGLGMTVQEYGSRHPGEEVIDGIGAAAFPRGSLVTFKYRELTKDGIPKEARYFRRPASV